mgnify:CR=1 FL=1
MVAYADFHRRSIEDRDAFWSEQAKLVDWETPPQQICDYSNPPFAKWFVGGKTNLCHNAVDRHLKDRADQAALIFVSTETDQEKTYTYRDLHAEVQRMAAILKDLGVVKGDRVLIYMPMIAEAAFAMLACARLGAIHSVVFGGFASHSLASRIDDAKPKVIVSADAGSRGGKAIPYKPLLDEAVELLTGKRELYLQEPSVFYYPGLPQKRFYDPAGFPWLEPMLALVPQMQDELAAVLASGAEGFAPYVHRKENRPAPNTPLLDNPAWTAFHFWQDGAVVADNAARCPATMEALAHAPMPQIPGRSPNAADCATRVIGTVPPRRRGRGPRPLPRWR